MQVFLLWKTMEWMMEILKTMWSKVRKNAKHVGRRRPDSPQPSVG